jgi:hypothetical protein
VPHLRAIDAAETALAGSLAVIDGALHQREGFLPGC